MEQWLNAVLGVKVDIVYHSWSAAVESMEKVKRHLRNEIAIHTVCSAVQSQ